MIAPAREAAYDALRAVSTGSRRPSPCPRARPCAAARRTRSGARRRDRHRHAPMAGRVRPRHRGVQPPPRDAIGPRSPRHPAKRDLSTAAPGSRAGRGRGQRRRQHDPEGRQEKRRAARQRPAAPRQPRARPPAASRAPCQPGRPRRRARLPRHHALAPAMARGPMAGSLRLCGDRSLAAVQQPSRAADDSREQAADVQRVARRIPGGARRAGRARTLRPRRVAWCEREILS